MKRYYRRTNKTKNFGLQIGQGILRGHALTAIAALVEGSKIANPDTTHIRPVKFKPHKVRQRVLLPKRCDGLAQASADVHHQISSAKNNKTSITEFLKEVKYDPAYEVSENF